MNKDAEIGCIDTLASVSSLLGSWVGRLSPGPANYWSGQKAALTDFAKVMPAFHSVCVCSQRLSEVAGQQGMQLRSKPNACSILCWLYNHDPRLEELHGERYHQEQ